MQPPYGNCITEEVTEMPRCCSSRIQSEVAWRAALRPLTVPAIWMAPPNSSSFSVSVVLPASGCEMIAKVRRRAISAARSVIRSKSSGQGGVGDAQSELEHGSILATGRRLIVAAPAADLLEAHRQGQAARAIRDLSTRLPSPRQRNASCTHRFRMWASPAPTLMTPYPRTLRLIVTTRHTYPTRRQSMKIPSLQGNW